MGHVKIMQLLFSNKVLAASVHIVK